MRCWSGVRGEWNRGQSFWAWYAGALCYLELHMQPVHLIWAGKRGSAQALACLLLTDGHYDQRGGPPAWASMRWHCVLHARMQASPARSAPRRSPQASKQSQRTFFLTAWHVQSNTLNIKPQLAKLPPIRGASRRIVCRRLGIH